MVQTNQDDSTFSLTVTEIVKIASRLSHEEFAVNYHDLRELVLKEKTVDDVKLRKLIDVFTSIVLVNENKKNEWVPNLDLFNLAFNDAQCKV